LVTSSNGERSDAPYSDVSFYEDITVFVYNSEGNNTFTLSYTNPSVTNPHNDPLAIHAKIGAISKIDDVFTILQIPRIIDFFPVPGAKYFTKDEYQAKCCKDDSLVATDIVNNRTYCYPPDRIEEDKISVRTSPNGAQQLVNGNLVNIATYLFSSTCKANTNVNDINALMNFIDNDLNGIAAINQLNVQNLRNNVRANLQNQNLKRMKSKTIRRTYVIGDDCCATLLSQDQVIEGDSINLEVDLGTSKLSYIKNKRYNWTMDLQVLCNSPSESEVKDYQDNLIEGEHNPGWITIDTKTGEGDIFGRIPCALASSPGSFLSATERTFLNNNCVTNPGIGLACDNPFIDCEDCDVPNFLPSPPPCGDPGKA
jgi:hypothetical protein